MSHPINSMVCLLLVLASLCVYGPARAQDAETTATARALFEQGMAHADAGEWEQAADALRRSNALHPSPVVAFNLARANTQLGRLVAASEALRAVSRASQAPARLLEAAAQLSHTIEARIGSLQIDVTGPREGVSFTLDGRPVRDAMVGVRVPADPGAHVIAALRGAERVASAEVTIADGGAETVSLELPPAPEPTGGTTVPGPDEAARAGASGSASAELGGSAASVEPGAGSGGPPWLVIGISAGVVAVGVAILLVVVLASGGTEDPVPGNLQPGIIEF